MRKTLKFRVALLASLLLLTCSGMTGMAAPKAASWPSGSVQFMVPAKAGGGTDIVARIITGSMQKALGKAMVIVNQASGGGTVAYDAVRTAKPDGNTILFFHTGILTGIHTGLYDKSAVKDFTLLGILSSGSSYSLAVGADSPYKSVKDLVDAAKQKPGKVTVGVQTKGATHFMAGLLMKDSGAKFKLVEAGSDADKLVTLQGGMIDAALINTSGAKQYAEAGKIRILATISGSPKRDPIAPDVPSFVELGYKNTTFGIDFIVLGPKGIPAATAKKINAALGAAVKNKDVIEQLTKANFSVGYLPFKESATALKKMDKKMSVIAKELGLGN